MSALLSILMYSNPSLRVAYIDEVEEREGGKSQKVYYSVLVKAVENLDQVIDVIVFSLFIMFTLTSLQKHDVDI